MAKKLRRKEERTVVGMLEAVLELMGWQAELVRSALRQVRREAQQKRQRKGPKC